MFLLYHCMIDLRIILFDIFEQVFIEFILWCEILNGNSKKNVYNTITIFKGKSRFDLKNWPKLRLTFSTVFSFVLPLVHRSPVLTSFPLSSVRIYFDSAVSLPLSSVPASFRFRHINLASLNQQLQAGFFPA